MMFSEEEITMVKQADLVAVATAMGYTPKRIGRYYTLKEMDSIRIYNRSHWYRWSSETGGSQIDFVMTFAGMEFNANGASLRSVLRSKTVAMRS